jgi:chaperonin GroES
MNIRPIGDRVLVRRDSAEEKTQGGIIIPDNAKEPLTRGTVLAVGPGRVLDNGARLEPTLKTGDHILFGKYSGSDFENDGEKRIFMREKDILGVIEEDQ